MQRCFFHRPLSVLSTREFRQKGSVTFNAMENGRSGSFTIERLLRSDSDSRSKTENGTAPPSGQPATKALTLAERLAGKRWRISCWFTYTASLYTCEKWPGSARQNVVTTNSSSPQAPMKRITHEPTWISTCELTKHHPTISGKIYCGIHNLKPAWHATSLGVRFPPALWELLPNI